MVHTLILVMSAVVAVVAVETAISPWLYTLRPTLFQFGYDAEVALACHRLPPDADQAKIEGALASGVHNQDARWVRNRVIEGQANALVELQQNRSGTCAALSPERLAALQAHVETPLPRWPERK